MFDLAVGNSGLTLDAKMQMGSKVIPFKIPKSSKEFVRFQVDAEKHFYDKLHQHPEWQLTMILEGRGQLMVGDYLGRFEPGDVFLFSANMPHVFRSDPEYFDPQSDKLSLGHTLFFDFEALGKGVWEVTEFFPLQQWLHQTKGCYALEGGIKELVGEQLRVFDSKQGWDRLMATFGILQRLQDSKSLRLLNRLTPLRDFTESEGKRMAQVMSFILAQSHRNVQLQEVADVAIMSKEAFCRFFKERTGKTFTEFLNQIRIQQACQLLLETDLSISQIAFQVGFQNLSYFNRTFRKLGGSTPKEYRIKLLGI
ncbi:Transcriptional regulator, AraC family [Mariniradius saccharolyticus AK6]|uniref:Transcriptional regulator, AraC family n=2 Tax=Mariniradius TaxID=1245590 RepID=M7YCM9_9BACT|nr:Transcriptional regulator, AraC family [Mariniradius saccharolyticus AK6]